MAKITITIEDSPEGLPFLLARIMESLVDMLSPSVTTIMRPPLVIEDDYDVPEAEDADEGVQLEFDLDDHPSDDEEEQLVEREQQQQVVVVVEREQQEQQQQVVQAVVVVQPEEQAEAEAMLSLDADIALNVYHSRRAVTGRSRRLDTMDDNEIKDEFFIIDAAISKVPYGSNDYTTMYARLKAVELEMEKRNMDNPRKGQVFTDNRFSSKSPNLKGSSL